MTYMIEGLHLQSTYLASLTTQSTSNCRSALTHQRGHSYARGDELAGTVTIQTCTHSLALLPMGAWGAVLGSEF